MPSISRVSTRTGAETQREQSTLGGEPCRRARSFTDSLGLCARTQWGSCEPEQFEWLWIR